MAGLEVRRDVSLIDGSAVVVVREQVTSINKLGRIYNMVQHPSIAAPFLDTDTVIDCNGKRGFAQGPNRTNSSSPEIPSFEFPDTINREGIKANARRMTGGDDDVQSYEVDPGSSFGWVCYNVPWTALCCHCSGGVVKEGPCQCVVDARVSASTLLWQTT